MTASRELDVLVETYSDETALDQVLDKLLDVVIEQYRARLARYDRELRDFEKRYEMESAAFYRHFEAGELGDVADYFEWAGLYEMRQELAAKIRRLELAA